MACLVQRSFIQSRKTLHALCIPPQYRSEHAGPAAVAVAAEAGSCPSIFPRTAPAAGGSLAPLAGVAPLPGEAVSHWLGRIQLLSPTLTQLMLLHHPSGAEGGETLSINPATASAAELSAAVRAGETPYLPPNLNGDRLVSVTPVPSQRRTCPAGCQAAAPFVRSTSARLEAEAAPAAQQADEPLCLCWAPTGARDVTYCSHLFARKQP